MRLELVGTTETPALIAESERVRVFAVRWPVFEDVYGEGLLLEPKGSKIVANVVAMPDCDTTPEQFVGLAPGLPAEQQIARLLAEQGCRVVVPTLLDRSCEFSGNPAVRMTNLSHREWIWRMAFETGRHPIGYEVEKVRALVDLFSQDKDHRLPVGVTGYGEGGLIAFHAAAADPRIDAAWVAGYFNKREGTWSEPIERDVFGLLEEFGDAEIANLIIPRGLFIEACDGPVWKGPSSPRNGRSDGASGHIEADFRDSAKAEWQRRGELAKIPTPPGYHTGLRHIAFYPCNKEKDHTYDADGQRWWLFFLDAALLGNSRSFVSNSPGALPPSWTTKAPLPDPHARMKRQVQELVNHTQALIRTSELRRYAYWSKADTSSPEAWAKSTEPYRETLWNEVIGKFPPASEPLKARTVKLLDEPKFVGYGVELPVWPDVVASGILLLPKDLKEGEKRPVVVCQHGLEGRPNEVVDPHIKSVYHAYGAQLADRGYIVYAPQNPYIGVDRFRQLQRKLHPLKKSLFAVIVRQHERTLEWLKTQPNVDPDRIAFYGLSYGGKTAMRVPAMLKDYCLSICSGDFNEWVVKCTNLDRPLSYLYTIEYDMYEWDLAGGFNYAEMAGLIAPRPFQVERGHKDGVAPDEWIGYEYAKVKRLYDTLGIGDRTDITYFNGPHEINGQGTFAFLAKHLRWPRGASAP